MGAKTVTAVAIGVLGGLATLGAMALGCSAEGANPSQSGVDDGGVGFSDASGAVDSGSGVERDGSVVPGDAGITFSDSATDSATPGPTTILAVHASATLAPFRLCFGVGPGGTEILPYLPYPADPSKPMPGTNIPGVPVGGAAFLPPITFPDATVTVYVTNAISTALETDESTSATLYTCDQLICDGDAPCLINDYAKLPPVTVPFEGGPLLLVVGGCPANAASVAEHNASGSPAQCGASFADGGTEWGNLSATTSPLASAGFGDAGGGDAGEDGGAGIVLQVAQLSPSFNQGADTSAFYVDPTTDASVAFTAPALAPYPTVTIPSLSVAGSLAAYVVIAPDSGAPVTQALAAIQYFQAPAADPTTYFNGQTVYFAAIVGDATGASAPASLPDGGMNPAFDGRGLHLIAFPEVGN